LLLGELAIFNAKMWNVSLFLQIKYTDAIFLSNSSRKLLRLEIIEMLSAV